MNQIWNYLWHKDPGFFRFKHAFKTVFAVVLSVLLFIKASLLTQVLVGMAAGFSIQGISGEGYRGRLLSIVIADFSFVAGYLLGASVNTYPRLSGLLLVVLAFLAMYVRRFGPRFAVFPILVWVFCFLGSILPEGTLFEILWHGASLLPVFIISGVVYFFLFPEKKKELFYNNMQAIFSSYASSLRWQIDCQEKESCAINYIKDEPRYKLRPMPLLQLNQSIAETLLEESTATINRTNNLFVIQFALGKAITIIYESFEAIYGNKLILPKEAKKHIGNILDNLAEMFSSIEIDKKTGAITLKAKLNKTEKILKKFKEYLSASMLEAGEELVPLLNINLGFRMIFRNLALM